MDTIHIIQQSGHKACKRNPCLRDTKAGSGHLLVSFVFRWNRSRKMPFAACPHLFQSANLILDVNIVKH
jgi:hypothetical protein